MNKLLCYQISIICVLYIGYGFFYLTRKSISFMIPHFSINSTNSFNVTKNDIGIIISSQNVAYALSKFIGGVLSDVVSCRILFGAGLFLSGLLNIAFKKEIKVYSLYGLSFLIGLVQGPAWPCCGKIMQNWLPKSQFATWWSVLSTSANLAGAIGPILATTIAMKYHWSYGFMIPGCICMSVGYLSIIILRNKPSDVKLPNFNDDETQKEDINIKSLYADENEVNDSDSSDDELILVNGSYYYEEELSRFDKLKMFFSYPFFLCVCLAYFMVQLVKTLFSDWSQIYLIKSLDFDPFKASYFLSIFELSGIFGSILSGIISDLLGYLYKNLKNPIDIRMSLVRYYLFALVVCLHLFNFYVDKTTAKSSAYTLIIIAFMAGFICYGSISLLGVIAMEFSPKMLSGSSHAIATLAANLGAIFAGVPFSLLSKYYSWNKAFILTEFTTFTILIVLILFRKSKSKFQFITYHTKMRKDE